MNYAKTTFLIFLFLISSLSFGQTTVNGGRSYIGLQDMHLGSWRAPEKTVSTLPSASTSTGLIYMVTDGASSSDCSIGGGSTFVNACRSNGTNWVFIGGSGGGGGGTWGSITGTLSAQTDLNTALNARLIAANNLSDLASATTARTNLGLGTAATQSTGASGSNLCLLSATACAFTNSPTFPTPSSTDNSTNGATTAFVTTAISNLTLGTASTKAISFFLQSANNLSDLGSATTARTNLGLGSIATHPTTDFVSATTSQTANQFLAAPNGSSGAPVFRAIVAADIPTLNQSTTGNAATATALASTPSQCSGSQLAIGITAIGNANCTTPTAHTIASPRLCADTSGSGTAQSCTTSPSYTMLTGDEIIYSTTTPNSSSYTITVNGSAPWNVYKWGGSTLVAAGDICVGKPFKMVLDAAGHLDVDDICNAPGGSSTTVQYTLFRAINQNTIAGSNFSLPASNAPTAISVEGASSGDFTTASSATNYGTLSFAANSTAATANTVQGTINLPSTWSSSAGITVQLTWRTSATTGNALWAIQGQCVAAGAVPGSFSSKTSFTASAAPGTTLEWAQTPVLTLTTSNVLSGCSAGNIFMFRLGRDHQNSNDTITATEELIQAAFGVSQ